MGDPRVASPILRRPARYGLAASDRGYAGCELRRILLPRTRVNKGERMRCGENTGRDEGSVPIMGTTRCRQAGGGR